MYHLEIVYKIFEKRELSCSFVVYIQALELEGFLELNILMKDISDFKISDRYLDDIFKDLTTVSRKPRFNLNVVYSPPYEWKVWHFRKVNNYRIRK